MSSPLAPSFIRRHGGLSLGLALIAAGSIGVAMAQSRPAASSAAAAAGHGLDPADMNLSARACQDFYQYADGGWLKKNPDSRPNIRAGARSPSSPSETARRCGRSWRSSRWKSPLRGSEEQKIGDFYASCMDEAAIEAQGAKPIASELERIDEDPDRLGTADEIARLQTRGVNAVFGFGSAAGPQELERGDRAAPSRADSGFPTATTTRRPTTSRRSCGGKYVAHVAQDAAALLGDDAGKAAGEAKTVLDIETKLAEVSMTRVERRDPDATYHRMRGEELKAPDAELLLGGVLQGPRRAARSRRSTSASRNSSRRWTSSSTAVPLPVLEDLPALAPRPLGRAQPLVEVRRGELRLHGADAPGDQRRSSRAGSGASQSTDRHLGFALGKLYVARQLPAARPRPAPTRWSRT